MENAIGQEFKSIAKKLMPVFPELLDIEDSATRNEIDEIMFRKSEYVGRMAAVIIAMIEKS